jgi:OmpA-OmpF porin, OOP family
MKKTIYGLFGLLILLCNAPAQADTLYFAVQAGFSTQPTSSNQDGTTPGNNFQLDTSLGYNAALAIGAKFGNLRAEIEGVYRVNDNDSFDPGGTPTGADGNLTTANIFLNGYYDIDLFGVITPYAGVGVGYGKVSLDLKNISGALVVDDNDTVYSYQLIAGAAVNVSDSWSLTAEYRYFDTITDAEFSLNGAIGIIENSDIRSHEVRFGLRYWFF